MLRLRVSLENPDAARLFAKQGEGPVAIARTLEGFGRVPFWEKLETAKVVVPQLSQGKLRPIAATTRDNLNCPEAATMAA